MSVQTSRPCRLELWVIPEIYGFGRPFMRVTARIDWAHKLGGIVHFETTSAHLVSLPLHAGRLRERDWCWDIRILDDLTFQINIWQANMAPKEWDRIEAEIREAFAADYGEVEITYGGGKDYRAQLEAGYRIWFWGD